MQNIKILQKRSDLELFAKPGLDKSFIRKIIQFLFLAKINVTFVLVPNMATLMTRYFRLI